MVRSRAAGVEPAHRRDRESRRRGKKCDNRVDIRPENHLTERVETPKHLFCPPQRKHNGASIICLCPIVLRKQGLNSNPEVAPVQRPLHAIPEPFCGIAAGRGYMLPSPVPGIVLAVTGSIAQEWNWFQTKASHMLAQPFLSHPFLSTPLLV